MPNERASAHRALSRSEIVQRESQSYQAIYFLGLGLFQGIVATRLLNAFFFAVVPNDKSAAETFATHIISGALCRPLLDLAPYALTGLQLAFVIYSYWWWITLVRRSPRWRDVLLPLGFAFAEFGQIAYVGRLHLWLVFTGLFCFVAIFALGNSRQRLLEMQVTSEEGQKDGDCDVQLKASVRAWHWRVTACAIIGVMVGLTMIVNRLRPFIDNTKAEIVGILIVFAALAGYSLFEHYFLKKLRKIGLLSPV